MNLSQDSSKRRRKIRILYADDRPENVRSLLQGVQAANILPEAEAKKLVLHQLDRDDNMAHNHEILHHADALVEIDYATLMEKAIEKVRHSAEPFDLIVSDWYFGEYDPDFKDSQIGGIWIMLWGQSRQGKYKPVCKLYTAQQTQRQQRIDFTLAKQYIQQAFGVEIAEIRKSETAASWQQHLEDYLSEVAKQLLSEVAKSDLVAVINYLSGSLAFNRFHNSVQDKSFETFRWDLLKLNDFELHLPSGETIAFTHLFPLLMGRYLRQTKSTNFFTMPAEEIAALLYARRLVFTKRDERDEKLERLRQAGVDCQDFKEHDAAGNPLYGIEVKSADYYEGPLTTVNNLLTQALDYTFKVQSFYLNEQGFSQWLHFATKPAKPGVFEQIRDKIILPDFQKIKTCFSKTPVALAGGLPDFSEQISSLLQTMTLEDIKREDKDCGEKNLEEKFLRLQNQVLFDALNKKPLVPVKCLFRLNVHDFLTDVMQLRPLPKTEDFDEGYEPLEVRDFYWYGHAWLVREGLRAIIQSLAGPDKFFIILKPKNSARQALMQHKIVLRDRSKGLSTIARAFVAGRGHLDKAVSRLQGFCDLEIRSKIEGEEGIAYDAFRDTMDRPCPQKKTEGTEFVLTLIQRRDR